MKTVNLRCAVYKVALAHLKWRYDTYEGRDFRNDPFHMSSFDVLFAGERDLDVAFKKHKKEALNILFQDNIIISDQLIAQAHVCEPCEVSVYRLVLSTYIRCNFDLAATRIQLYGASSKFYNKYMGSTVREKYTGSSDGQSIAHWLAIHPANFTKHPFYNFFEAITSFRKKPEVKTIHPTIW